MKDMDGRKADTLINNIKLLLDIAQQNLCDLQKTLKDPKYMETAYKTREVELFDQVNELLAGLSKLRELKRDS